MDSGGDKHPAVSVDDQSSVVVADVEWLEELAGDDGEVQGQRHGQTLKRNWSSTQH